MLKRVTVRHFKRFHDEMFDVSESVLLVGPNNCGKTTLIQAIAVWNLGLQKWLAERRIRSHVATSPDCVHIVKRDSKDG